MTPAEVQSLLRPLFPFRFATLDAANFYFGACETAGATVHPAGYCLPARIKDPISGKFGPSDLYDNAPYELRFTETGVEGEVNAALFGRGKPVGDKS